MKRKFRSALAAFCFAVFGIGSLVFGCGILPIFFVVPAKIRRQAGVALNRALWIFFTKTMCVLGLIGVRGNAREKLARERGAIVVANHPSLIDVVLLVSLMPRAVCVVKGALAENFWMRQIVRRVHLVNTLALDDFFSQAENLLRDGYNILIFPEGTRTRAGTRFHRGAAHLALRTGAPIVPVKISVTPQILGKNQLWWDVADHRAVYKFSVFEKIFPPQKNAAAPTRALAAALTARAEKLTLNQQNLCAKISNDESTS